MPYFLALAPGRLDEAAQELGFSVPVVLAISVGQSALVLAIMVFSGLWAAQRVGLGAPILDALLNGKPLPYDFRRASLIALVVGVATALLVVVLEFFVFIPADPTGLGKIVQAHPAPWKGFLASFYGGITEEVQLRLFLLSFLALGIHSARRLLFRSKNLPVPTWIFWSAIIIAAILFGLGHLPTMAELLPLTPLVVVRTLVLNGIVGIAAGFLFWRHGIETAMICHFSADIVLHVLLASAI